MALELTSATPAGARTPSRYSAPVAQQLDQSLHQQPEEQLKWRLQTNHRHQHWHHNDSSSRRPLPNLTCVHAPHINANRGLHCIRCCSCYR